MADDSDFIAMLDRYDAGVEKTREEVWHWPAWKRRIFFDTAPNDKQVQWERERFTQDSL